MTIAGHASENVVRHPEELVVYALLIVVGAIPVVFAVALQRAWAWEAVLGSMMVLAGVVGTLAMFVATWRRRRRARFATDRSGEELVYDFALAAYHEPSRDDD